MGERQLKYLDMLQSVISRMAGNQFTCRAWSVTLGTALIGYSVAKDNNQGPALLAILPAGCFWILDAYYLAIERAFRDLFKAAVTAGPDSATFNFDSTFSLTDYLSAAISPAVWIVHLPVIALAFLVGRYVWHS